MLQIPHDQMMQLQASYLTFQHLLSHPLQSMEEELQEEEDD